MFESYVESESNTGFKGFVRRHFGPVIHADIAEEGLREIGLVFIVLYLLSGVFGFASTQNLWILGEAFVMAVAADRTSGPFADRGRIASISVR